MKQQFIISLGSNLSVQEANDALSGAEAFLTSYFGSSDIRFSTHYETAGVGSGIGKTYVNSVAKGETDLRVDNIVATLKTYELSHGRTKEARDKGIVPIDLDLLLLGDRILKSRDLTSSYVVQGLKELE